MYWSLAKLSPPRYLTSPRGSCFLRSWPVTTLNSRDAAQAVRRWSLKAHVLPQFVLGFHLHLGGAARSESFPTHCSRHLPACSLLPRRGLLEFPGRWTSYFALQDRAGSRLETEKVGSGVGSRKKLLVFSMKWGARSPWDARDMMVVGRQCSLSGQGWLRQMGIKGKQ